jgi:hypothetical protein
VTIQAVMPAAFITNRSSNATTPSANTLALHIATSHPSFFHSGGAVCILDCISDNPRRFALFL